MGNRPDRKSSRRPPSLVRQMSIVARTSTIDQSLEWQRQPRAQALVRELMAEFCTKSAAARQLSQRMRQEIGARFFDWVDFVAPPRQALDRGAFLEAGFTFSDGNGTPVAEHPGGMFPTIRLDGLGLELGSQGEVCGRPPQHQSTWRRECERCALCRAANGTPWRGSGR